MYNGGTRSIRFMKKLKIALVSNILFNARKLELRVAAEEPI
jgi:hypothetical protein